MAKFIQSIHDRLNFAAKKGLTGYFHPSKIDSEVHAESLNLWLKYTPLYAKDREIKLALQPFEKVEAITGLTGTPTEGKIVVVACNKYPISAAIAGTNTNVRIFNINEYNHIFNHPTKGPAAGYPILKFVNDVAFVAPNVDVDVTYLAEPVKPKYAFTAVSGDLYAYDDANSTDIEWDERYHDQIMVRALSNLGISMREQQLIQFAMIEKQGEGK